MSNMNETVSQAAFGQNIFGINKFAYAPARPAASGSLLSVQALKQAASRIAEMRRGHTLPTRDLVGLLICHTTRSKRMMQQHTKMRMKLPVNSGKVAVRITIA